MSFDGVEEDYSLARDQAKNSRHPRSFRWQHRGNALLQKKLSDQLVVSKTIYDPANTLSKKAKKRLQKEEGLSDFQPDVQYSLNKYQRWKTLSVPTLLENSGRSNLEILVVNRVITPRRLTAIENLNVSEVHAEENGAIRTISTKGKGHKYSHFQAALRERREVDKDEVEPARILINVVEPHPVTKILAGKAQRKSKKGSFTTKSRHPNYSTEVSHTSCSEDSEDEDPFDPGEQTKARRSSFTLGDFLQECCPSTSCSRERSRKSSSWSFVEEKPVCPPESDQPRPADLVDISAITNVNSVFEVIDLKTHSLQNFSFPDTISRLEQERFAVRWIDPDRAMVEATYHVRLSGDEPIRKPLLILFFELREKGRILRLRINADVQYVEDKDREVFIDGIIRRKDFPSSFQFILETVRSLRLRELEIPKENSRCSENPGYFAPEVNSNALAVKAGRCHEYDKLQFLRNAESLTDYHKGATQITSSNCSRCSSSTRSELFETRDGMTCRECIASDLIHQLRLNRAPIDIPLLPAENLSNFDLLYGVVPALLITELIKVSYLYYRHLTDPGLFLSQCPRCFVEVAVIPPSEEDTTSCVCPECKSHWCWLCKMEPHWPMNCDEFKQWIVKWDQHYFVSKHLLLPNEDLLRISCTCGHILHLPSESAHNTICRCGSRYDKTGMMCWDHVWWPYYPRLRKERDLEGKPKDGYKVDVERIPCQKLIAKEFADACTEVRNLRFDKKKRLQFEKSAMVPALESSDLANQRITGLVLVENCTAWLYLHRREDGFAKRKSAVLHLLQRLRSIENDISRNPPSPLLLRNAEELGRDIKIVMDSFREHQ
ncbi:hypothetical protein V3C99_016004 [Haemonchus contortus]